MKIAAIQHDIVWENPQATFATVLPMLESAADQGVRLAVLSEMFGSGFSMDADRVAEPPGGQSESFLLQQAERFGLWTCGSIPTRDPEIERPVNRLVLAAPDGRKWSYDKIHPFTYAKEHLSYAAGDRFLTVDVEGLRCSFFVCYDLRFGNEFWGLAGETDCYVVPANWPEARRLAWTTLLAARAIENQAYVVGVNRVGVDPKVTYVGDSRIIDPLGEELVAGGPEPAVLVAEVDAARVAEVRARFPFLQDRRAITTFGQSGRAPRGTDP